MASLARPSVINPRLIEIRSVTAAFGSVRVTLASGLLTGALSADAEFPENDHRNFNRDGEAFTHRRILDHDAVTTVIPGSTTPEHVRPNAAVGDHEPPEESTHEAVREVYDAYAREYVHTRW